MEVEGIVKAITTKTGGGIKLDNSKWYDAGNIKVHDQIEPSLKGKFVKLTLMNDGKAISELDIILKVEDFSAKQRISEGNQHIIREACLHATTRNCAGTLQSSKNILTQAKRFEQYVLTGD